MHYLRDEAKRRHHEDEMCFPPGRPVYGVLGIFFPGYRLLGLFFLARARHRTNFCGRAALHVGTALLPALFRIT